VTGFAGARRLASSVGLALVLVAAFASPASAHATLLESDPAPGAVLQQPPAAVTLNFDSPVVAASGAIRVYGADGSRLDDGHVQVSGATVRLPLPRLKAGSYVVTWRVTSADTHPVGGAFTFQVGTASNATSPSVIRLAQQLLGSQGGDRVVGVLYGATRWLVFAGLALFLGAASFGLLIWPTARRNRRAIRLVWAGWTVLVVATVAGLVLYGPYAAGLSLSNASRLSSLTSTLRIRYGELACARLALLLVAVPALRSLYTDRGRGLEPPPTVLVVAGVYGMLLAATPGLAAHAVTGRWVTAAVIADTLHVLAMAVWLGGLVALAAVLLPRRRLTELRATLPRWSWAAAGCLTVIVATGVFQAYRQVGGMSELRSTDYGRLLLVKLVAFAFVLPLAAFGREIVLRLSPPSGRGHRQRVAVAGGSDDDAGQHLEPVERSEAEDVRRLRRSVWAEVGVGAAVLAVTALLVNAPPARSAAAVTAGRNGGQLSVAMRSSRVRINISLTPGRPGSNDVHVTTLTPSGSAEDFEALRLTLDLPSKRVAPISVPLTHLSTGHYLATGFTIPLAGTWRITAYPLVNQFDELTVSGQLKLGS
jgi:copper transport protein